MVALKMKIRKSARDLGGGFNQDVLHIAIPIMVDVFPHFADHQFAGLHI